MMPEYRVVIGREEILRPPPRPLALDHRVDGDVADPELLHGCFTPAFLRQRIGRPEQVQAEGSNAKSTTEISDRDQLRSPGASWPVRATYSV
jgi:hypothetical protein